MILGDFKRFYVILAVRFFAAFSWEGGVSVERTDIENCSCNLSPAGRHLGGVGAERPELLDFIDHLTWRGLWKIVVFFENALQTDPKQRKRLASRQMASSAGGMTAVLSLPPH